VIAVSPTVRPSGSILESAKEHWTIGADGQPFRVQAGTLLPDFARAGTRQWWSGLMAGVADLGFHGAVVLPTGVWPEAAGAKVQADQELGGQDVAARYAGILPSLFARATRDGLGGEAADRRPLVMSGGYWPGMQRFAGLLIEPDATASNPHWAALSRAISAGASGQPFVGLRIPTVADPRSQSLWIGLASCLPLMQGSFAINPAAPMAKEVTVSLRQALKLRTQIEPYLYTLCFDAFFRCQPIVSPVLLPDNANGGFRICGTAFMLGKDLLVVPRLGTDPKPASPLPGWRRLTFGDSHADLPDLYLRPGAILPVAPSQLAENGPELQLLVSLEKGVATGVLYEDDGDGYSFYRNKCRRTVYRAEAKEDGVFLRLSGLDGGLPIPKRRVEVVLLAPEGDPIRTIGSERGTIRITPRSVPGTPESPK
jgi:alpha-glucosidase